MPDQFAISFHETLSLSRASLGQIVEIAFKNKVLDRKLLADTALGNNYQKAMPLYALRAGLLDENKCLTAFGHYVAQYDPALEKAATQWLLHYHLASPHGSTAFWHFLFRQRFLSGNIFTADELVADLEVFLQEKTGKLPPPRSLGSTITIFTGTYLKFDGLGRLGLLDEITKGTYRVPAPAAPPIWALGYALADYWNANQSGKLSMNLDDLIQGDFAAIFMLGEERLLNLLLELKQEGLLDLYRLSQPYQVLLLQPNPEYALQKMYAL